MVDSGGGVLWPLWQLSLSSVVATLQVVVVVVAETTTIQHERRCTLMFRVVGGRLAVVVAVEKKGDPSHSIVSKGNIRKRMRAHLCTCLLSPSISTL